MACGLRLKGTANGLDTGDFKFRLSEPAELNEIVELLKKNFEMPLEYWKWKYLENPSINDSLIVVAERAGRIIGCGCWLPRSMKIADELEINSLIAAHLTVEPEYRKHGLGKKLIDYLRVDESLRKIRFIIDFRANP